MICQIIRQRGGPRWNTKEDGFEGQVSDWSFNRKDPRTADIHEAEGDVYDVRLEWLNERKTRDCDFSLGTWPIPQLLCAHTHQTHMLPVFTQHVSTFATCTKKNISFFVFSHEFKDVKTYLLLKMAPVFRSYVHMSTHFNNFQSPYMSALNIKERAVL